MPCPSDERARLSVLAFASDQPSGADGHEGAGPFREQYSLSLGSYGRPRMTMELKEAGLDVGERRVGRLMRINGIKPVRTRKQKVTTDSHHRLGVAANWLDGDFPADAPRVRRNVCQS